MFKIFTKHGMAPAMCESIGKKRHKCRTQDGEQPKTGPQQQQRPDACPDCRGLVAGYFGERIDYPSKQHGLGKQRHRERHVGKRKHPAESAIRTQFVEHAQIKTKKFHVCPENCALSFGLSV